jgi:outer membrane immunogenic protein
MKKLVSALTAVAAFSGSALAADMSAPAYTKAPMMPAPVANWTGFYLFGGAGGGLWDADTFTVNPVTGNCAICGHQSQGGTGWFGTVGGGYDWQFNTSWVAGVFADGQFGSLKGTIQDQGNLIEGNEKLQTSWAVGVRAGWLVAPQVLSYVNGGFSSSHWSGTTMFSTVNLAPNGFGTPSFNRDGWFVGGGVENNLNIFGFTAPGLFMKTEYRAAYYNGINLADTNAAGAALSSIHFKAIDQTISTSLVYRFNWGGPVMAKY